MVSLIFRQALTVVTPFIIIYALYIQVNGEVSPGGGFQAGAILASSLIGCDLVFGSSFLKWLANSEKLNILSGIGLGLYTGVGLLCMLLGGNYLDYDYLGITPKMGQHVGIILIELGVGVTVASTLMLIYQKLK